MEIVGHLVLRIVFGSIFIMHGFQQLGLFDGSGLAGPLRTMQRKGFRPAWLWARFLAYGCLTGGVSLLFGAFTALGSAVIVTIMVMAIATSKTNKGFWNRDGGWEFNLSLIGGAGALGFLGPGPLALDTALAPGVISPMLFLLLLAACLGVAGLGFLTRTAVQPAFERMPATEDK